MKEWIEKRIQEMKSNNVELHYEQGVDGNIHVTIKVNGRLEKKIVLTEKEVIKSMEEIEEVLENDPGKEEQDDVYRDSEGEGIGMDAAIATSAMEKTYEELELLGAEPFIMDFDGERAFLFFNNTDEMIEFFEGD